MTNVADNLAAVRKRMAAACLAAGRPEDDVALVAVTKRIDLSLVAGACAQGQLDLGENRLPEAVDRQEELAALLKARGLAADGIRWHFIGHIQSRKAVQVVGRFVLLHGVDSLKLARKLSARAVALGLKQPILLEVNISGEEQKNGLAPGQVLDAVASCLELPGLEVRGLMGMARYRAGQTELHDTFGSLRRLAEEARSVHDVALPELSMGMSGDFEIAIAEGATLVRVGSAIFGPRPE